MYCLYLFSLKLKQVNMKKISLVACLLAFAFFANAQLSGVINRAKQRAENKVNDKVNKKVDDAVDSAFSTKEKPGKTNPDEQNKNTEGNNQVKTTNKDSVQPAPVIASIKVYSKYDFIPGERIIAFEDFMQDNVGDFPDKWNTNSSGEVVTLDRNPGHWLMMPKAGTFMPEFIDSLQDNFTFEFDLFAIHGNKTGSWGSFHTVICQLEDRDKPQHWQMASNNYYFSIYGGNSTDATISWAKRKNGTSDGGVQVFTKQLADKSRSVHVSIWRQKERLRVYFNEEKVLDIPKALTPDAKYNSILYYQPTVDEANYFCVSNLRLAVGAPDVRNKMLTQNKWVTHGILFDVNSANIKPESYGTLKEMANVLKEYSDLKVKIVGHTDADGSDAANLDLSKKRAASVKTTLAKEFGIDESRMETDGKGESEPMDKATTPAAKANNRRVEFIKL
jgi:OOP family OmpA-OmpF porin